MAAQLYPMRIGASAASPTTPTFAGIVKIEMLTGGIMRLSWAAGSGTITGYKIYLREASSSVFSDTYWLKTVRGTMTSTLIQLEADNATLLRPGTTYYLGVKAINETVEDVNTVTLDFVATQNYAHFKLPVIAKVV